MKDDGGRWHEERDGGEGGRDREIERESTRRECAGEKEIDGGREKSGGAESVGEGRRGNGIVMSPASSSSDPQSREFVGRMHTVRTQGRSTHVEVKS